MNDRTLDRFQRTIQKPFEFEGVGLHTGKTCHVRVSALPENSGVCFFRTDLVASIPLSPEKVTGTARGTTLTGEKNASIHTIEHFLAAVHGFQVDNLRIEMDSEEMPIMDGSSILFCELLHRSGIQEQKERIKALKVREPFEIMIGDTFLRAEPAEGLCLEVHTSFPYPGLEQQTRSFRLEPGNFEKELAPARTFCFEEEIEALRKQGLIKGGNLENALVIGKKGVLNGPFRFEDEIVRHKTLDLLGDLMLLNRPLQAKIIVRKAGHRYHVELAKAILQKYGGKNMETTASKKMEGDLGQMDVSEIQKYLPHRYPFLMLDRILEVVPQKHIVALKNVTINEPFFQGHFPAHPVMPGVLLVEAMAQAGGVALLAGNEAEKGKIFYLAGVDNARFRKPVLPGDQVRIEVEITSLRSRIVKFLGKAMVEGQVVSEAEITCAIGVRDEGNGNG